MSQKRFRELWVWISTKHLNFSAHHDNSVDSAKLEIFELEDPPTDKELSNKPSMDDVKPTVMKKFEFGDEVMSNYFNFWYYQDSEGMIDTHFCPE